MQSDNPSPQSPELPNLLLSDPQVMIIKAHLGDAIRQLTEINFVGDENQQFQGMMAYAFHQGRLQLAKALITYDQDREAALLQQEADSTTQQ